MPLQPAVRSVSSRAPETHRRSKESAVARVLIVDDHAAIRRGVQAILHPFPEWEFCGEADNGNDAIRMAAALKPDVIIMDVSMPGLNGIDATRAIRKTQPEVK